MSQKVQNLINSNSKPLTPTPESDPNPVGRQRSKSSKLAAGLRRVTKAEPDVYSTPRSSLAAKLLRRVTRAEPNVYPTHCLLQTTRRSVASPAPSTPI